MPELTLFESFQQEHSAASAAPDCNIFNVCLFVFQSLIMSDSETSQATKKSKPLQVLFRTCRRI